MNEQMKEIIVENSKEIIQKIGWGKVLSQFPDQLQQEFENECPNPDQEDIERFKTFYLLDADPVSIPLEELLQNNKNIILHSPPDIIKEINQKWGTNFNTTPLEVYDQNPARLRQYSAMPPETAAPSVLIDGEIAFGVGRFIAALLRKDNDLKVWRVAKK